MTGPVERGTTGHPNRRPISSLPKELRRTTVPPQVRDWVTRETGATVVRAKRLPGASTTAIHGLSLSDGTRLVLRRYVWPGFVEDEPIAPRREKTLQPHAHRLVLDFLGVGRANCRDRIRVEESGLEE